MDVLVAGGTGFVGRSLCRILDERGHTVTAASRSPSAVAVPDSVETRELDVTRPDLTETVAGHDSVINLVALPSHREPRQGSHGSVHRDGTRHLLSASVQSDVERFVQMSGLGVDSGIDTAYFRAKREAERLVVNSPLDWVIFRPSVVFGDGAPFLAFVDRVVPPFVAPLPGGGKLKLQPIWVEDLTTMVVDAVVEDRHVGEIYEVGGPEQITFRAIVEAVNGDCLVVPIPLPLAAIGFAIADVLPFVPIGLDQYRAFHADNVVDNTDVSAFGLTQENLLSLSEYLNGHV